MATDAFEDLSESEAQQVLAEFLADGKANICAVIPHAEKAGVECNYSVDSLAPFLRWAFTEMRTVPREPDPDVPSWILSTDDYQKGLFDFEDRSKNLICYSAYYLGESFIRSFPSLKWSTGNREYYQANMPVVVGFGVDEELPPVLVIENLFRRATKRSDRIGGIDTAVATWLAKVE